MRISITGAELTEGQLDEHTFGAIYSCKRCKVELAKGVGKSPKEARKLAKKEFDFDNRNFCHICGLKLNTRNLNQCPK